MKTRRPPQGHNPPMRSFVFSLPRPGWARPAASRLMMLTVAGLLSACADKPLQLAQPRQELRQELEAAQQALAQQKAGEAARVQAAAATAPAQAQAQREAPTPEPRFDLIVNGAPVRDVFLSLVTDTRYSMMVHPAVSGNLSVTLKSVTLREALESLRDVYGFDFKIDGRRITVFPPTMQTRVFTVNYLQQTRVGRSELRVSAGAGPSTTSGGSSVNGSTGSVNNNNSGTTGTPQQQDGTQVSTSSRNDFWSDTSAALRALIGTEGGRAVISSPQAGTVAVRAMPDEMRHVEAFLKSTKLSVERQVMLEAKIVEVELREGFQSGIDWSVLGKNGAIGQTGVNPSTPTGVGTILNPLVSNSNGLPVLSTAAQNPAWTDLIPVASPGGAAFGLALTRGGFQGLISFLESHGDAQILSSPRVATLNNQKAVLKVGSDDYFVTGITSGNNTSSSSTTTNTTNNVIPTLTLTPFFSGIALDVTPQIDEENMITLHIHPAVTSVTEKVKQIDLGTLGNFRLPLASNSMNETDTVVRIPDGAIVAIGGLMQMESNRRGSGLPGSDSNSLTATLFGNRANSGRKRELIVLIKPSIIRSAEDWEQHNRSAAQAMSDMDDKARRVITVNGNSMPAAQATPSNLVKP